MPKSIIISDIGGTNGRFALATFADDIQKPVLSNITVYPCNDYDSVASMLMDYKSSLDGECPTTSCLAVAGPATVDHALLTNHAWHVDARELEQKTGFEHVYLMNDFAALGYSTTTLQVGDFTYLTENKASIEKGPISVLGPGTGFGIAMALPMNDGSWKIIATEGGHMSYAPKTPLETDLVKYLSKTIDHVSIETLLSGAGLQRIHQFLVDYGGGGNAALSPAEITASALRGDSPSCSRAVQLFLSVLGGVTGDIALVHGATGGVYIGGGVLPKMKDLIGKSDFLTRFSKKGDMCHYLADIPIRLITSETASLMGTALAYQRLFNR